MSEPAIAPLFAPQDEPPAAEHTTGILPSQSLRHAIANHLVQAPDPILEEQIQPASLDLRLGPQAYRVKASFLPGRSATVKAKLDQLELHRFDLTGGAVLERDCVYIIPLLEHLSLRKRISAIANPKSSTGRLDVFTRLITDYGTEFDSVRERYEGPLYAEVSPRAFPILVRRGSRLMQLRIKRGSPTPSDSSMRELHEQRPLIDAPMGMADIKGGIALSVDIDGAGPAQIVGYRARKNAGVIDVDKREFYDPLDFWEPMQARAGRGIILDPHDFYILASKESITIPTAYAAEMLAYDTSVGEFRVHYAGFFDPGFGDPEIGAAGTRAVLEVRSHEVPFLIEDGQIIGRLVYERLIAKPDKLYGQGIGSSYQRQGLTLGKQFKRG
ncbi:MAG: 2'-deoxycytidine 5'-triphosphate deaminase [Proteobacteria bacterium]|nr:2'-deoxycytidine 5'-triphosphate deaminase [Pseudomonadota bacterium]MBI3497008.1 2'-deoxycytidine 5'-triphosphate deaminase [Pseudomonadota bacterium]